MDRDVVVVLHPDLPLVLTGEAAGSGAVEVGPGEPTWTQLLDAARELVPDGSWPFVERSAPGLRLHAVRARTVSAGSGYGWVDTPDPRWPDAVRAAVAAVLDEVAGRVPIHPRRAPWMRAGWWPAVTGWVDERLGEAGRRRTGDLEPREHWGPSAVARVPTEDGAVWVKAVPPMFAREPAVLRLLGECLPGRVPHLLAAENTDGGARFLMVDAGEVPDDVAEDDPPRLAALLAELQVLTLDLMPRLAAAGCDDRSPTRLASEMVRMAHDGLELDQLDDVERATLLRLLPELSDRLLALAEGPLPAVLVHGDFHPWNVARATRWSNSDAVIFDWTDAAIGPAGVDLTTLLRGPANEAARARVRDAYASVWAATLDLPPEDVRRAVAAAAPAGHVVQALAYDTIPRGLDPGVAGDLSGAMAEHLRALITLMSAPTTRGVG